MAMNLKNNKYLENLKEGFLAIKTVLQEGNVKLFVKQAIAVLLIFLLFKYVSGKNETKVTDLLTQIDAITTQESSEQEYLKNKEILLNLEPRFPDATVKNEWLLGQVLEIFKNGGLTPQVSGQQSENTTNPTYVTAGLGVTTEAKFGQFAEFLAGIENLDEFLKVSSFSLKKDTSGNALGNNQISMRFNTIFLKERIASRMFKDYAEQMAKRQPKTDKENDKGKEEKK